MEKMNELLETVTGRLEQVARSEVVFGSPIELGNVTVVPLSRVSVGVGIVGGESEAKGRMLQTKGGSRPKSGQGKGEGGGTGGGAVVRPVGVAVFTPDSVEVLSIPDREGVLDKVFERVPEIVELLKQTVGNRD